MAGTTFMSFFGKCEKWPFICSCNQFTENICFSIADISDSLAKIRAKIESVHSLMSQHSLSNVLSAQLTCSLQVYNIAVGCILYIYI